jgi:glucokinase
MSKFFLAMDIGGTKTMGALFSESGALVDGYVSLAQSKTYEGEEAVYKNTKSVLDKIIDRFSLKLEDVIAISVGSPGPLDTKTGVIIHAPLMKWHNFPLIQRLKDDYHTEVFLDNDGNLGALAEQRCGVAKGLENVLYMTVSTGCGGGIVLDGKIYHGMNDGAGEVGHISIDPHGPDCPCGSKGCFELYASGTAMNRQMVLDMEKGVVSEVFSLAKQDPKNLNGKVLDEAAEMGDTYALELFKKEGFYLGYGIANQFNMLNPNCIVLGGGVTKSKRFFHDELMRTLRKYCLHAVQDDSVRYSELNDKVVLYGTYFNAIDKMSLR